MFISDVGAANHTLFICICCVVGGFYILSLFAERWLRHIDRLPTDVRRREKIFDWIAIIFTIIGSCGLILLSIFDAFNHSTVHWSMTLVFIVGVAISAVFQSAEVWCLHKSHPDRQHLWRNSIAKLIIVTLAILCAIAFGVTYKISGGGSATDEKANRVGSGAAGLEWAVAFILVFYFFTLVADLWPAGKSSPRYMRRLARWQEKHDPHSEHDFTGRHAFSEYPEAWQGPDGRALAPDAPVGDKVGSGNDFGSNRPSTNSGSEAALVSPYPAPPAATYNNASAQPYANANANPYANASTNANAYGTGNGPSDYAHAGPNTTNHLPPPISDHANTAAGDHHQPGATFNAHTGTWND